MSSGPMSRSIAAMPAATASGCETSNGAADAVAPSAPSMDTAASSLARLRPFRTTCAPAAASPRAMAKPSPPPPPVTSAWRPERSNGFAVAIVAIPRCSALAEHVLHVEHARLPLRASSGDEARGTQRALSEIHARRRAMREFDALAVAREYDRVIADDIAPAQRREADRARLAFAGDAMPRVDSVGLQASLERRGGGFAELQRRARGRVDLVPMMHFHDFDIVVVAEALRRDLDQLGQYRHADAHVRRIDDGDRAREIIERATVRLRQSGRSYHRRDTGLRTRRDLHHCPRRSSEVDQHVRRADRAGDVGPDDDTGRAAEALARVAPDQATGCNVDGRAQREIGSREHGFYQRLAHAPARAGDGDADLLTHCPPHQPIFFNHWTSQFSSPVLGAIDIDLSRMASPPPARATSAA